MKMNLLTKEDYQTREAIAKAKKAKRHEAGNERGRRAQNQPAPVPAMTGDELRAIRKRLGWTQPRMASALGVRHQSSFCRMEKSAEVSSPIAAAARMLAKIKRV